MWVDVDGQWWTAPPEDGGQRMSPTAAAEPGKTEESQRHGGRWMVPVDPITGHAPPTEAGRVWVDLAGRWWTAPPEEGGQRTAPKPPTLSRTARRVAAGSPPSRTGLAIGFVAACLILVVGIVAAIVLKPHQPASGTAGAPPASTASAPAQVGVWTLTLSTDSAPAGSTVTATIHLPAAVNKDTTLTFLASPPGLASVPAGVIVPKGSAEATFKVAIAAAVPTAQAVAVSGRYGQVVRVATLVVTPASPAPTPTQPTTGTTPTPPATTQQTPVSATLTFQNTMPGTYSDVFIEIKGPPGSTGSATLSGPAVDSIPTKAGTMDSSGSLHLRWTVTQPGTYTASGTVGQQSFTAEVDVEW